MTPKKRGLGRDLSALLSKGSYEAPAETGDEPREIALDRLQPGRHQPRRHFDETALAELSSSIAAQGVLQPIVVRPVGGDRYEIVAGERRWRAAKLAGLSAIPVLVRTLDERGAMAVALVENIQRADLNALEEAEALHRLIEECRLTHEQVAEAVGRSRAAVSNLLRVMELQPEVQTLLREGGLTFGHAKVLLAATGERQVALARRVAEQGLSVRQTEALLQAEDRGPRDPRPPRAPGGEIESRLAGRFGLPTSIEQNAKGRGRITIRFRSPAELDELVKRLGD